MEQITPPSRRDFLKLSVNFFLGLSGLLGLGGLLRYFGFTEPQAPRQFNLGAVADFPVGSRTLRAEISAVIYNRAGKIEAMSLTCTHLGCTVEADADGFMCPCHGSRYDSEGAAVQGPAQKRLPRLRVELLADQTLRLFMD